MLFVCTRTYDDVSYNSNRFRRFINRADCFKFLQSDCNMDADDLLDFAYGANIKIVNHPKESDRLLTISFDGGDYHEFTEVFRVNSNDADEHILFKFDRDRFVILGRGNVSEMRELMNEDFDRERMNLAKSYPSMFENSVYDIDEYSASFHNKKDLDVLTWDIVSIGLKNLYKGE